MGVLLVPPRDKPCSKDAAQIRQNGAIGKHGHPLLVAGLYTCRVTTCLSPRVPSVTRHRSHAKDLKIPLVSGLRTLMVQCKREILQIEKRALSLSPRLAKAHVSSKQNNLLLGYQC